MSSSNRQLQSIYVALDNHQYNKAIKHCLALPASHQLAQALLAHAYFKAGQRYKCLLTIQSLLTLGRKDYFPELQLEIKYAAQRNQQQQQQQQQDTKKPSSSSSQQPHHVPSRKSGKKGKKKGVAAPAATVSAPAATNPNDNKNNNNSNSNNWDLVDQLDTPPKLPEDWETCIPPLENAIVDETLLSTLSSTLRHQLLLPLTSFQLYCWAASKAQGNALIVSKAFLAGFAVLVWPSNKYCYYETTTTTTVTEAVLSTMKMLALQLARIQQHVFGIAPATAWAAQTALWQLEYSSYNNNTTAAAAAAADNDKEQQQQIQMLSRLAESLASKCIQQQKGNDEDSLILTENFLLYLRTLDVQHKWEEKLKAIDERLSASFSSNGHGSVGGGGGDGSSGDNDNDDSNRTTLIYPPRSTLLDLKAQTLHELGLFEEERHLIETELIRAYPDNWSYWIRHAESALAYDKEQGLEQTEALITKVLLTTTTAAEDQQQQKYPLRGPHLMKVEIAARRLKRDGDETSDETSACSVLTERIMEYGDEFASRASCTFSDLCPYFDLILQRGTMENVQSLLEWLKRLRVEPGSSEPKVRRRELRAHIAAVQMTHKLLSVHASLQKDWLPDWIELLRVWKTFQSFDKVTVDDQMENRPADELILLAVQQLLCGDMDSSKLATAAVILEAGMRYSPHNAHLKISAMYVYSQLNATSRSWELFETLFVKHIQYESCAYLILPLLQSGAMYEETISVCKEILRLQRVAVQDAGEFAASACENGALSKADEFIRFQRRRLNNSLMTLEAKGLILDNAPLFVPGTVGAMQGIVGGESDAERAIQIVEEAHNPFGAFSLLRLRGPVSDVIEQLSDNRDFSVLANDVLAPQTFETPQDIVRDSIRRGHQHNLLIRAALCVEMTKGPKKGKVVVASDTLKKRCATMLAAVEAALEDCTGSMEHLLLAMLDECRVIAVVSAGILAGSEVSEDDSLEARESHAVTLLAQVCDQLKKAQEQLAPFDERSLPQVCRLLPECIVPIFAAFRMCAKLMDLFGWGRRKRQTKRCAAALADVAVTLGTLLDEMKTSVKGLPDGTISSVDLSDIVPELIEDSIRSETASIIGESQRATANRVEDVIAEMRKCLDSFDVKE